MSKEGKAIAKEAAALLAGLGDTPEEIAAMLLGAGYKGVRRDPTLCPCGACLRDHLGQSFSVGSHYVRVFSDTLESGDLTDSLAEFIENFDAGEYPMLEKRMKP